MSFVNTTKNKIYTVLNKLTGYYTIEEETSGHSMLCYGYDSSDKDDLKLLVYRSSGKGVDDVILTCNSTNSTIYNMNVKNDKNTKEENGTFEVTGITFNSKGISKK